MIFASLNDKLSGACSTAGARAAETEPRARAPARSRGVKTEEPLRPRGFAKAAHAV
jgi:hypothetical protein